jgi:hypothetical protein
MCAAASHAVTAFTVSGLMCSIGIGAASTCPCAILQGADVILAAESALHTNSNLMSIRRFCRCSSFQHGRDESPLLGLQIKALSAAIKKRLLQVREGDSGALRRVPSFAAGVVTTPSDPMLDGLSAVMLDEKILRSEPHLRKYWEGRQDIDTACSKHITEQWTLVEVSRGIGHIHLSVEIARLHGNCRKTSSMSGIPLYISQIRKKNACVR